MRSGPERVGTMHNAYTVTAVVGEGRAKVVVVSRGDS